MRFATGGRTLERLAGAGGGVRDGGGGGGGGREPRPPSHWPTIRSGFDPWRGGDEVADQEWLRSPAASLVREGLQQALLFPVARMIARPEVFGAEDLMHVPQPAVIAPNHSSDIDTPLILAGLPRSWRKRTVVGAASDRFYRRRVYAISSGLWINTFPFGRGSDLRGLADAAELLRAGHNVLLYPQATRSTAGQIEGFRAGVARLCLATGAPLLPVHVSGTALIMPASRGLTQRGRATVRFGRPLSALPGESADELMVRARAAITELGAHRPRG
ncbi:MAG: 1-acyl-sn-glycerol-3-phosphate acyltransferase [Solirubrobacteraceae bacterium]|nr:1-acyl-sn-glycerol-3-phosphate acyltransferase [Solirubrobacteraceae bacterium]